MYDLRGRRFLLCCVLLLIAVPGAISRARAAESQAPAPERIRAIAALLPAEPQGVGRPITDRAAWQAVAQWRGLNRTIAEAEKLLQEPIPELTDDLYLDYSKTGNRRRCEAVLRARHGRVVLLTIAECLENKGRFLPAIEAAIRAVGADRSWVLPAHDRGLQAFRGETMWIDLQSTAASWNLATASYWLGAKLNPDVRKRIAEELERRTFAPFTSYVGEGEPKLWWITTTNNWNAVCLAGVTGAALAAIESPERRAFFVAASEKYIQNFLHGFTPDGYCSEGIGYFNYGFGHFVLLADTLHQATGGKVDLLDTPHVRQVAQFGLRMEILPGIYPAFADCGPQARPSSVLLAYLNRRFGFGWNEIEQQVVAHGPKRTLFELGVWDFPNSVSSDDAGKPSRVNSTAPAASDEVPALRHWFADAGVLICRPAKGNPDGMGVALKGGNNAEHHNHNDLGSFVVAWQGDTPLLDVGSEVYTARTFGPRRYDSRVLNSFGHPVPVVAGQLQREGRQAKARIVKTEFTDAQDTLILDLKSAYPVKSLKRLERTFVFSRRGQGQLTVTDDVEFDTPQSFGTALMTFSPAAEIQERAITLGKGRKALRVQIAAGNAEFKISREVIREDMPGKVEPIRLGIDLKQPTARAQIRLTTEPALGS